MKAGDRIRLDTGNGMYTSLGDYTVEEFRHCLGVFLSNQHREAGRFTPLCALYERGAESESKYISNFGEYTSNKVQAWMDIPK
jgi:hypothetical protein